MKYLWCGWPSPMEPWRACMLPVMLLLPLSPATAWAEARQRHQHAARLPLTCWSKGVVVAGLCGTWSVGKCLHKWNMQGTFGGNDVVEAHSCVKLIPIVNCCWVWVENVLWLMYVCIGMTCLAPSAFFSTSLSTIVLPRLVRNRNKFQGIWSSRFYTRYWMAFTTCTPTGCCTGTLWVVWGSVKSFINVRTCAWCGMYVRVHGVACTCVCASVHVCVRGCCVTC